MNTERGRVSRAGAVGGLDDDDETVDRRQPVRCLR
jgi:hypothetical protein